MSKRIRNFIMTFAIAILGLVILPNDVKAYDFSSTNSSLSKFYFHATGQDSSTYIDLAGNFNTTDYNQIIITEDIVPASRLVLKLYRNNFNFFGNTDYKISFYMKASFDVSTLGNELTFRLCENDYTCTVTDYDSFFVEEVEENLYKITTIFGANVTLPQVVSFWFDDVNVSAGDYYGIYKYFDYEVYDPSVESEEPVEPEEENYIYIPQMPNYPISTTLIDSYMKNKIDLSIYNNVFYETCYENGSRYFWTYYMPSSNDFSYNNSTGLFTINPVTNGTFYRVMFTVNSTGTITGMSSVETWNHSLDFRYVSDTSKRLYFSTFNVYDPSGNLLIEGFEKENIEEEKEFYLRETYDATIYELESLNFNFDLQDLYNNSIGKDFKIKIEVTNPEEVETIIENISYGVFYKEKNTGFYEKTDFEYFPLEYEYVENEHSLYLIFKNNLNMELYYYDGVRFSVNFKNSYKNILNIYANVEYGTFELFSSETENFLGYQKVLISSQYKDYVISASESKSFSIIAKRENVLNLTEGDLIVFKYDFSTPIYSSDTFEILNEGITLSPYPWGSYNGTYNDYVEFYVTLDYLNNKVVLIRNNHDEDFYIWIPYDVNISPVKSDGSFELVTPDNGTVDGNTSSNNKDYTNLPTIGDENFFSYIKKGISSFTSNISYIFESVANIFNGFNEGIQTFFITIFFISLALFVIRFLF